MTGAIYMAAAGALVQQKRLAVLANNLSNIHTAGFKKDTSVLRVLETGDRPDAKRSVDATAPTPLQAPLFLQDGTQTDFSPGPLKHTRNPFDIALADNGFFCVQSPDGIRYTRNGHFTRDPQGLLVTQDGLTVMGNGGEIRIDGQRFNVDLQGNVSVDGARINTLRVVDFDDPGILDKIGDTLFAPRDPAAIPRPLESASTRQGFLELSNVDPVKMMTEMIEILRGYESYQKAIRTLDDTNAKAINGIGQVT